MLTKYPEADANRKGRLSEEGAGNLTASGGLIKYTELRSVKHNTWIQAFSYQSDDELSVYISRRSSDPCDLTPSVCDWLPST